MSVVVRYGSSGQLTLALADERLVGVCGIAASPTGGDATGDVFVDLESPEFAARVRAALDQPLEFPDFSQAVVVGDHVTIVVEPDVPQAALLVTAVAERLLAGGVAPDSITVLHVDELAPIVVRVHDGANLVTAGAADSPTTSMTAATHSLRLEKHVPADRGKLSFLANTRSGRPVYLNRLVTDADMVVSVGCYRGADAWTYRGIFGGIYPTFSDTETLQRYRNAHLLDVDDEAFAKSQQEIELVGWQSGLQATVQVLPGPDGTATVVAGEMRTVRYRAAQVWNSTWRYTLPKPSDLVVVALPGQDSQTWRHVGRALAAALPLVDEGGAVALCTDLSESPGKAFEALRKIDDRDTAVAEIRKVRPEDAFPALMLDRVQRRARVYLLSRLDPTLVEELGIARVEEPVEIERLVQRRKSCIVLGNAQFAEPQLG
ncbi:MAG: hypothetical protein QM775_06345 [Pirellulales bacterium]